MKLDRHNQFVTLEGTQTGVYASLKKGRWQYRDSKGQIIASGPDPARFVHEFWYRDDFVESVKELRA